MTVPTDNAPPPAEIARDFVASTLARMCGSRFVGPPDGRLTPAVLSAAAWRRLVPAGEVLVVHSDDVATVAASIGAGINDPLPSFVVATVHVRKGTCYFIKMPQ